LFCNVWFSAQDTLKKVQSNQSNTSSAASQNRSTNTADANSDSKRKSPHSHNESKKDISVVSSSAKVSISPPSKSTAAAAPDEDEYSDPGTMKFSSTLMQRSRAESDNNSVESTPEVNPNQNLSFFVLF
jgi:hypothetical protein